VSIEAVDVMEIWHEERGTVSNREVLSYGIVFVVALSALCIGCVLLRRIGPDILRMGVKRHPSLDLTQIQLPHHPHQQIPTADSEMTETENMMDPELCAGGRIHAVTVPEESVSLQPNLSTINGNTDDVVVALRSGDSDRPQSQHTVNVSHSAHSSHSRISHGGTARLKLTTTDLKRIGSEKTDISTVSAASTSKMLLSYGMEYDPHSRANSVENMYVQPQQRAFRNGRHSQSRHLRFSTSSLEPMEEERQRIVVVEDEDEDEERDMMVEDDVVEEMRMRFQRNRTRNSKRESGELKMISLKSPPLPPLDDSEDTNGDCSSDDAMYNVIPRGSRRNVME